MTQSNRSTRRSQSHGPTHRSDTTRPPRTRSRTRADDRRPWPTASTTTRVSPAKPGVTRVHARSRGAAATPIPATAWPAGAAAIDLHTSWPTPILTMVVGAFSKPGERVVLLPWPTTQSPPKPPTKPARRRLGDSLIDAEVAGALAAVAGLDRTGRVVHVAADPNLTSPMSPPLWADLVDGSDRAPVTVPPLSTPLSPAASPDPADSADLVITSLRADASGDRASEFVALAAAGLLRVGGIFAVLTHCDWQRGELIDPTGALVAAAQNADLLYLQHIIALHVPVRSGRLATDLLTDTDYAADDTTGKAADAQVRAAHQAAVRGLPTPHRRIHSDVLLFAQPREHHDHSARPSVHPAPQPATAGTIR